MKTKHILSLLLLAVFVQFTAVSQVQIGNWREHLSYKNGVSLCEAGTKIYVATFPSLFYLNTEDNSIEKVTKVEGLSDLGINVVKYSPTHSTVILGYSNGNIDLIVNNEIINIPDVKRSFIQGDKAINEILINGEIAYLSTGFGIIAINIAKQEIKETFILGTGATFVSVNECCLKNDTIYAATKEGVYFGDIRTNLVDFQNWSKFSELPTGSYNTIVNFNESIVTNFQFDNGWQKDTVYTFNDNKWEKTSIGNNYNHTDIIDFNVSNDTTLLASYAFAGEVIDTGFNSLLNIYTYGDTYQSPQISELIIIKGEYWMADKTTALAHRTTSNSFELILPSGPNHSNAWSMDYSGETLWMGTGALTRNMKFSYENKGIAKFSNNEWSSYHGGASFDSLRALHAVVIDPDDPDHIFAASYGGGVVEFQNNSIVKIYNETNSTLESHPGFRLIAVGGIAIDNSKTIWMTNSFAVNHPLSARDKNNNWYGYSLNNIQSVGEQTLKDIVIDKNGNKWIAAYLRGLLVFHENGTLSNQSDDLFKKLTTGQNNGNLPTNEVNCMAEDADGKMFIGTSLGLVVISDPQNVFTTEGVTAEKIVIEVDGEASHLLGDEIINTIHIDASNRKWIGTDGAGVFLFSEDLQEEIYHFNTLNSPLIGDVIYDIEINDQTGEVYFSTNEGLVSFMGTATDTEKYDGPVYSFPNPVPPNYTGTIGIRGLINNAEIKITDITGNLVYETFAEGGTGTWDGNSLTGERVQSGVYIVHVINAEGTEKQITKILFLN